MDPCSLCNALYVCWCAHVPVCVCVSVCGGCGTCRNREVSCRSGGPDGEIVAAAGELLECSRQTDRQTASAADLKARPVCRP